MEKKKLKQLKKQEEKQLLKYVNNKLVTKENLIENLTGDNELSGFNFKDYANVIKEGRYVDVETSEEEVVPKKVSQKKKAYMKGIEDDIEHIYEQKMRKQK